MLESFGDAYREDQRSVPMPIPHCADGAGIARPADGCLALFLAPFHRAAAGEGSGRPA